MGENQFGQVSKVDLLLKKSTEKTLLSHVAFTAPFKVMKPFYDDKNNFSIMIMSSSAGIMSGDRQEMNITVEEGASGHIYSQSYEKIHKMEEGVGVRNCTLRVKSGGSLRYSPLPTIPYEGSNFKGKTVIFLENDSSKLIFSEILSCGRVAMGESFQFKSYETKLTVYCAEELLFSDNGKFQPSTMDLTGFCFYEGYTHQSMLLLFHWDILTENLEKVQVFLEEQESVEGGFTRTFSGGLLFRFLGFSGDSLEKIHQKVLDLLF